MPRRLRLLGSLAWLVAAALVPAAAAEPSDAPTEQSLRARHAALSGQLQQNPFQRPLVLESTETPDALAGHIHAVLDTPFAQVQAALADPRAWCEILSLHSNTKYCRATAQPGAMSMLLYAGNKTPQSLASAVRMEMAFTVVADTPGLLAIGLRSDNGPLGTSDYRVTLAAIPLADGKTYIQLGYATATNTLGRLAMQAYLATAGRGKVGFTRTGLQPDGQPAYLGGARGAVERNTMRYHLAIDAYLASLRVAAPLQFESRLQAWFSATERYPRQLYEMDRPTYVAMKRDEHLRQQSAP